MLRCEAFRKLENLKAVAIADGPELDIGGVTVSAANTIARAIAIPVPLAVAVVTLAVVVLIALAIAVTVPIALAIAFPDNNPAHPVRNLIDGSIDARRPAP